MELLFFFPHSISWDQFPTQQHSGACILQSQEFHFLIHLRFEDLPMRFKLALGTFAATQSLQWFKKLSQTFFQSTIYRQYNRGRVIRSVGTSGVDFSSATSHEPRQENLHLRAVRRNAANLQKEPGV